MVALLCEQVHCGYQGAELAAAHTQLSLPRATFAPFGRDDDDNPVE
jgi:hypothetical protein